MSHPPFPPTPLPVHGTTRVVGVIGWPVSHSLSPPMHNAALAALGLDWIYVACPVRPDQLASAVAGARALGFVGLNVTIPHKQLILTLANELDPLARAIGAVNTLHFTPEGPTHGYNTDAVGFTRTVEEESPFRFAGATVLQLGAGGVGRAMAAGAALAGAERVVIHARRREAATGLASELQPHFPQTVFDGIGPAELSAAAAQVAASSGLIANATPLGMHADDALPIPAERIDAHCTVFDTVYTPAETALLLAARARGAATVGGLGMLARQGAHSLRLWSGREPDEALMLSVLRASLSAREQAGA